MKKRIETQDDNQFVKGFHTEGPSLPKTVSRSKTHAPLDQQSNDSDFFSGIINARFPRLKATPSFIKKLKEKL